jgi:hypothetical protein
VGTLFNTQIYSAIAVFPENPTKVKQEKVKKKKTYTLSLSLSLSLSLFQILLVPVQIMDEFI